MKTHHFGIVLLAGLMSAMSLASVQADQSVHFSQVIDGQTVNCHTAVTNAPMGQWNQLKEILWVKDDEKAQLYYICTDAARKSGGWWTYEFDCVKEGPTGVGDTLKLVIADNKTSIIARPGIANQTQVCEDLIGKLKPRVVAK